MFKKILPFTKKDSEKLYLTLNEILESNKSLQILVIKNNNENIELKKTISILESKINKIIYEEEKIHNDNIKIVSKINNATKNYNLKLDTVISDVYSEINNIVKIMNKSMFLEIVSNHKESLDKLLKNSGSKK